MTAQSLAHPPAPPAHRARAAPPARRASADDAHIRQFIADLYVPLEGAPGPRGAQLRRHEERELKRARAAAKRALKVRAPLSTRRAAAMLFSTGAMTLTAFSPPTALVASSSPTSGKTAKRQSPDRLRASDPLKQALTEEEGVRHIVYRDVAGYPTVGVGHLLRPGDGLQVGDRISDAQARAFLDADLRIAEDAARRLLGDLPVHQHEFDALVDLVYNVGAGNVSAEESPRLNEAIAMGDYEAIAAELEYTRAGGEYARGLDHRSQRRMQMFRQASYEDPRRTGESEA